MAKTGRAPYYNPELPFVDERRRLSHPQIVRFMDDLSEQANAIINLETDVTGTLPPTHGGTGRATLTDHAVLLGSGTAAVDFAAPSTAGFVLTDNGPGVDPSFQAPAAGVQWMPMNVGDLVLTIGDGNPMVIPFEPPL